MAIIDPPMVNKLMLVPQANVFTGAQPGNAIVVHKTASGNSAEAIANFFIYDPDKKSSHFVIGQDGIIVQCVHLVDGAGANCCVEPGYDLFWAPLVARFGNLNLCTISIEHVDPAPDNSTPVTPAQKASSFKLIQWIVDQYGLDINKEIKSHASIDPINRARCPGNYPWTELFAYLQQPQQQPGNTPGNLSMEKQFDDVWLSATNGYKSGIYAIVKKGFLAHMYSACYPTSKEIPTVNWGGGAVLFQTLSNGCYVAYATGTATIYDYLNRVLFTGKL